MAVDRENYFFTPRYTRGEVCKALRMTKDTLRHYEKCGIISPHEDSKNKYKYYSIADLEMLNVILFLRAMDVSIEEIPKFIECKDMQTYSEFLDEQISKAEEKIKYWNHVKNILNYLKTKLEDYKTNPNQIKVVENTMFRFRMAKFDYNNYDIEKMSPTKCSDKATFNMIKLKIVDQKWLLSDREDTSGLIVGHLCDEDEVDEDSCICHLPQALMLTTLEVSQKLPPIILQTQQKYEAQYEFSKQIYIVEHTFFNIFSQDALLRNIYFPIVKDKSNKKMT